MTIEDTGIILLIAITLVYSPMTSTIMMIIIVMLLMKSIMMCT